MSEYCYSTGQDKNNIYIFELKITYNDDSIIKKRLISDLNRGELIKVKNNIKKIKISLCILNKTKGGVIGNNKILVIKKNINYIEQCLYKNENLLITLNEQNDIICISYNILNN